MTDADGTLVASFTIDNATLSLFAKNSIVGRAVVIHAHEDDCAVVSSGTPCVLTFVNFLSDPFSPFFSWCSSCFWSYWIPSTHAER